MVCASGVLAKSSPIVSEGGDYSSPLTPPTVQIGPQLLLVTY